MTGEREVKYEVQVYFLTNRTNKNTVRSVLARYRADARNEPKNYFKEGEPEDMIVLDGKEGDSQRKIIAYGYVFKGEQEEQNVRGFVQELKGLECIINVKCFRDTREEMDFS